MKLPYKIYWPAESVVIAVMTACSAASLYFYKNFPDKVPTHWSASGEIDGWSSPEFAAFFFPALIVGMYLMMIFLPLADPKKDRYKEFGRSYQFIRLALIGYISAIYVVTSMIGIGYNIPINIVIIPAIGLLFMIIGNFMPKFKPNWFIGIRTPWTLSSETVWNKTHRVGGKLFMLSGLLMLLSMLLKPEFSFIVVMITTFAMIIGTVGYSWWIWRNEQSRLEKPTETPPAPPQA